MSKTIQRDLSQKFTSKDRQQLSTAAKNKNYLYEMLQRQNKFIIHHIKEHQNLIQRKELFKFLGQVFENERKKVFLKPDSKSSFFDKAQNEGKLDLILGLYLRQVRHRDGAQQQLTQTEVKELMEYMIEMYDQLRFQNNAIPVPDKAALASMTQEQISAYASRLQDLYRYYTLMNYGGSSVEKMKTEIGEITNDIMTVSQFILFSRHFSLIPAYFGVQDLVLLFKRCAQNTQSASYAEFLVILKQVAGILIPDAGISEPGKLYALYNYLGLDTDNFLKKIKISNVEDSEQALKIIKNSIKRKHNQDYSISPSKRVLSPGRPKNRAQQHNSLTILSPTKVSEPRQQLPGQLS